MNEDDSYSTGEPGERTITSIQLSDWLNSKAARIACDACGNASFRIRETKEGEPYMLLSPLRHAPDPWPFYFVECDNCGHAKLFSAKSIDRAIRLLPNIGGN